MNSLLKTTKGLSYISIVLLVASDGFLFFTLFMNQGQIIKLIAIYYSCSFNLFIWSQRLVLSDDHIHLISRSGHTVLTPGVDAFTGLDVNRSHDAGEDPQMFFMEDNEILDGIKAVYRPVTTNKEPKGKMPQTKLENIIWYIKIGLILCTEVALIIALVGYVWSLWIIMIPLTIFVILGIFFILRTRLNSSYLEILKAIL